MIIDSKIMETTEEYAQLDHDSEEDGELSDGEVRLCLAC